MKQHVVGKCKNQKKNWELQSRKTLRAGYYHDYEPFLTPHIIEACLKFANKLADARMKELDTKKTGQYKDFCEAYYKHTTEAKKIKVSYDKEDAPIEQISPSLPKSD